MKYKIGEMIFSEDPIVINEKKEAVQVVVNNTGDRSIQVCSHYHFFESNPALKFDRERTLGMRLDVPSGTAVRFEPGEDKSISLVPFGGKQNVIGFRGMTMGVVTDDKVRENALKNAKKMENGGDR